MAASNPISSPAFKETVSAVARDDRLVSGIVRVQSMYRGWKVRQEVLNRHIDQIGESVHRLYGLDPWSPTQRPGAAGFSGSMAQRAPLSPLSRPMYPPDPLRSSGARHPGYMSPVAPYPKSGHALPPMSDMGASSAASPAYPRGPASKYSKQAPQTWRLRRKLRMGDLMRGKPLMEQQSPPESMHGSRDGARKPSARPQNGDGRQAGREVLSESDLRLFEELTSPPKPTEEAAPAATTTGGLSGRGERKRISILAKGTGTGSRKPSQVSIAGGPPAGTEHPQAQPQPQEEVIPEEPLAEQQDVAGEEDLEEIPEEEFEEGPRQRLHNFRSKFGENGVPKRWRDTKLQLLRDDMEWLRSKKEHLTYEKQNRVVKKQRNIEELEALRSELTSVQEMKLQLLMEEEMKQRIEERQELEAEKQVRLEGLMQERELLESWKRELVDMLKQIAEEGTADPENETYWYQLQIEVSQQLEEVETQLVKNAEDLTNTESYFSAQTGNLPDEEEWMQKQWEDIVKQKEHFLTTAQEQRSKQLQEAEQRALEERAIKRTLYAQRKQWRLETRSKVRAMAAPTNTASGDFASVSFPPRPSELPLVSPGAGQLPAAGPKQPLATPSPVAPAPALVPAPAPNSNYLALQQPMTQMQMQQLLSQMRAGMGVAAQPAPLMQQLRQLAPAQPVTMNAVPPAAMTLPPGAGTVKPSFEIPPANTEVMFKAATAANRANFSVAKPPERPLSQAPPIIPTGNARLPDVRLLHKKPFDFSAFTASGAMPPASTVNYVVRHPAPVYAAMSTGATSLSSGAAMSPTTAAMSKPFTPAAATGVAQLKPVADTEM